MSTNAEGTIEAQVTKAITDSGLVKSKHCLPKGSPDAVTFNVEMVTDRPGSMMRVVAGNILTTQDRVLGLELTIGTDGNGKPVLEYIPFSGQPDARCTTDLSIEERSVVADIKSTLIRGLPFDPITLALIALLDMKLYPPFQEGVECDDPECSCHTLHLRRPPDETMN